MIIYPYYSWLGVLIVAVFVVGYYGLIILTLSVSKYLTLFGFEKD